MMRAIGLGVLIALLTVPVYGQKVRLGTTEGYVVAHLSERSVKRPRVDRDYHWLRAQTLQVTQGGVGGTVLHGDFQAFHPNGQLHEQGSFRYGLKDGDWKRWYANGSLFHVQRWRNGRLNGVSTQYSNEGVLIGTERYRNGKLVKKRDRRDRSKVRERKEKSEKVRRSKKDDIGTDAEQSDPRGKKKLLLPRRERPDKAEPAKPKEKRTKDEKPRKKRVKKQKEDKKKKP